MERMHRYSSNLLHSLKVLALVGALFMSSGCSALISGYDSEFQCPNTNKGKCVSVQKAYRESIQGSTEDNPLVKEHPAEQKAAEAQQCDNCKEGASQPVTQAKTPHYRYRDTLYKKLSSMITKPSTPLVVPPEVVRVLILSYTGSNNELFSYRYVYFFATEPKWIISTAKESE